MIDSCLKTGGHVKIQFNFIGNILNIEKNSKFLLNVYHFLSFLNLNASLNNMVQVSARQTSHNHFYDYSWNLEFWLPIID